MAEFEAVVEEEEAVEAVESAVEAVEGEELHIISASLAAAPSKPKNLYTGKTYNTADAVAEFFKKKDLSSSAGNASVNERGSGTYEPERTQPKPSALDKLRAVAAEKPKAEEPKVAAGSFVAGSHVRHEKYGKGLVLRREGSGDNVKLTISFPGFGQKKMIEKFAKLDKA